MRNEQIERFLEYLSRDRVLQRDLSRRARTPEQFYFNAARFAGLFGYSFSADQLRAWAEAAGGLDLAKLTSGNAARAGEIAAAGATATPAHGNPLRAA